MESLYIIRDAACANLDKIAEIVEREQCIPRQLLEEIDTLTHMLKSIETTLAMAESGYSGGDGYSGRHSYDSSMSMDGGSYDGGYSGRRGRSARTGRFVSRDGGMSGRRGYSRDGGDIMQELDDIMRNTSDNNMKQRLSALKQKMGNGDSQ